MFSSLPLPVLGEDDHYMPFDDVYGQFRVEMESSPTVKAKTRKSIPFNATQQHVKNVGLLLQCDECLMWRLLFSKRKLLPNEIKQLGPFWMIFPIPVELSLTKSTCLTT